MSTTDQLPEPELGCMNTAEQKLREALKQIANAEPFETESFVCDFDTLQGIARHALALPPTPAVQVPMTDDDVDAKCLTIIGHLLSRRERDRIVWRMAEAHHDIKPKEQT